MLVMICFYAIVFRFISFSVNNLEEIGDNGRLPIGMEGEGGRWQ